MLLAPTQDELEIASAAADYLRGTIPIERLHRAGGADVSTDLRSGLADLGWYGLAVPEDKGGAGLSAVEHVLFFREVGLHCGPVDILAQVLGALIASGTQAGDAILSGQAGVALAVADGGALRLIGAPDAAYAVQATPDGARLYPIAGTDAEKRPSITPANSMRLISADVEAEIGVQGPAIWQMGQLGTAAMLLGLADAALTLIVEYAKVRETFGRKIGAYQAVRHPCADMAVRVESARFQLYYAAAAAKEQRASAPASIDAAKHLANEAATRNADVNIQLHGGIGVTEEHDAHLLLKHALVLSRLFGERRALLRGLLDARLED